VNFSMWCAVDCSIHFVWLLFLCQFARSLCSHAVRLGVSSRCAAAVALPQSGKAICDLRGCRREECTRSARAKKRSAYFCLVIFYEVFLRWWFSEEDLWKFFENLLPKIFYEDFSEIFLKVFSEFTSEFFSRLFFYGADFKKITQEKICRDLKFSP